MATTCSKGITAIAASVDARTGNENAIASLPDKLFLRNIKRRYAMKLTVLDKLEAAPFATVNIPLPKRGPYFDKYK